MLQFCVSQQNNDIPFTFRATGIRVFSFEEAMYHIYHYWRESVDDFLSNEMITWVSELGLSFIANRMREIAHSHRGFAAQLLQFFKLSEYFDKGEIAALSTALQEWEARLEWEKLKERADYLVNRGEPGQALPLYKRALKAEDHSFLHNNIAVAYLQLQSYKEALYHFSVAYKLEQDNMAVLLHYIEAAILAREFATAAELLQKAEAAAPHDSDIPFLHGLMAHEKRQYMQALEHYNKARDLHETPHYTYKIVDVYMAMRQYEKALAAINKLASKDAQYYVKEADIHAGAGDYTAALRCIKEATANFEGASNASLWTKLAKYHRQDYNWQKAEEAIQNALELAPDNNKVRLEYARIKKGLGKTREYQAELGRILQNFKEVYRSSH